MIRIAVLVAFAMPSGLLAAPKPRAKIPYDGITPIYLHSELSIIIVRGTVLKILEPNEDDKLSFRIPCDIRIDHIYVNLSNEKPSDLRAFRDAHTTLNGGSRTLSSPALDPFKVGQVGIWVLSPTKEQKIRVYRRYPETDPGAYANRLLRVEFLEAYHKKKEKDRYAYCQKRVVEPNIAVAMSAGYCMGAIDPKRAIAFLSSKEVEKIHIAAQIDMDRAIIHEASDIWKDNEIRAKMIVRWAESEDVETLDYVMHAIHWRYQSPLEGKAKLVLAGSSLARIATNARLPDAIRWKAANGLFELSSSRGVVDIPFEAHVAILKGKSSEKLRHASAVYLSLLPDKKPPHMLPPQFLKPNQIARLFKLSRVEKDAKVRMLLEEAIAKAKLANQKK